MHLKNVLKAFGVAGYYIWSLTAIHLAFRLLAAAVIAPAMGLIIALSIQLSDQKALTDQDIAAFMLSPSGFIVAIILISLIMTAAIFDFTTMSVAILFKEASPLQAIRKSFAIVFVNLFKLFWFCNGLILRVLVLAAPFLALSAFIAFRNLTEFDINYYLTYWPPEFIKAGVIIGVILLVMVAVLVFFLSGWGIALHLYLAGNMRVNTAFKESHSLLKGNRFGLIIQILIWGVIRFVILAVIALLFSKITALVLDHSWTNLRSAAISLGLLFAVWAASATVGSAFVNGALADILLQKYKGATGVDSVSESVTGAQLPSPKVKLWVVMACAAGVTAIGAVFVGTLLERTKVNTSVEIIAHRGAATHRPENTMAAVEKAIEDQTDWVEIDVQESAEGELIIAHDSDFMKLAKNPLKTWDSTRADLDEIDIGSWYAPEYADERTPLLVDVLRAAKGRAKVVIELKYYGHDVQIESEVIRIVEEEGMADQVSLMSLKYPAVQKLKAMRPSWRVGVLAAKAVGDVSKLDADFLALNVGQISSRLINRAHSQGKDVYAWTVDDPILMSSMITMGVDGLITNDPALARSVVEYNQSISAVERLVLLVANFIDLSPMNLIADDTDA